MEEKLIEMIRENSFLYDKRRKSYKNIDAKDKKWKEIAESLGVPVQQAKKRWGTLRDRYNREKKKKFQPSGSGALSPAKQWKFAELMRFLDDVPGSNDQTIGNYQQENRKQQTEEQDEHIFSEYIDVDVDVDLLVPEDENFLPLPTQEPSMRNTAHETPAKMKRRSLQDERNLKIDEAHKEMTEVLQMVKQSFKGPSNSLNLFFSSAAIQVQEANLPPSSQAFIKSELSRIIMEEINKFENANH